MNALELIAISRRRSLPSGWHVDQVRTVLRLESRQQAYPLSLTLSSLCTRRLYILSLPLPRLGSPRPPHPVGHRRRRGPRRVHTLRARL